MSVPRDTSTQVGLDHPHAVFDQPLGQQQRLPEQVISVSGQQAGVAVFDVQGIADLLRRQQGQGPFPLPSELLDAGEPVELSLLLFQVVQQVAAAVQSSDRDVLGTLRVGSPEDRETGVLVRGHVREHEAVGARAVLVAVRGSFQQPGVELVSHPPGGLSAPDLSGDIDQQSWQHCRGGQGAGGLELGTRNGRHRGEVTGCRLRPIEGGRQFHLATQHVVMSLGVVVGRVAE